MVGVSKWPVLAAALFVCVGSLLLIALLLQTFVDERRGDLKAATVLDMASLGTCIEAPSPDAVTQTAALRDGWACQGDVSAKESLSNLLSSATHAIYHAVQTSSDPSLARVANVVLAAAIGTPHGSVNASSAKAALRAIEAVTMPASCDDVYAGAQLGPYPAVVRPDVTCGNMPAETSTNIWSASVAVLYAHCVRQFTFGESGPAAGSFGTPVYGEQAGWQGLPPFPMLSNFSGQPSSTKTKVYLGARFGACCWSYSLLMLGLGFCFTDGVMVILSDGSEATRAKSTRIASGRAAAIMMSATKVAKRNRRWLLLMTMTIVAGIFVGLFLWRPFGMG